MRALNLISSALLFRYQARQEAVGASLERLATGKRINRASDDPAGMIAVEKLTFDITTAEKRIQALDLDRVWLSARDGALTGLSDLLHNLSGTVVSAANTGALSDEERQAFADEAGYVIEALDRLSNTATFKGDRLLGFDIGGLGSATVTRLDEDGNEVEVRKGLRDLRELLLGDREDLEAAQEIIDGAVSNVSRQRGAIGARIKNGIEPEIRFLQNQLIELTGARSLIEDADYAKETSELVRNQILEQASIFTIQIAQQSAESVLALLKPAGS